MPSNTVSLEIRIKSEGKHPFVPAVLTSNGRVKSFVAWVNGKEEHHKEGSYYLRWRENGKQTRKCVGRDPQLALTKMQRKEQALRSRAVGLKVEGDSGDGPGLTLSDAVNEYIEDLRAKGRARKTLMAYTVTLNRFVECCPGKYVGEIGRHEMMRFMTCCRDKFKLSRRSLRNVVDLATFFLAAYGVTGLFHKGEKPKFTSKKPERYSPDQLQSLYAASTGDEKLLWQFFAKTGMREREVACAEYSDINYNSKTKTIRVADKPRFGFHPKDSEERVIPIPDSLAKTIADRRKTATSKLIFPNAQDQPDGHFLKKLQRVASAANLECKVFLHKFRVTFACNHHRNGVPARTIQAWLGHSDLETTLAYLAAEDMQDERIRELVNVDDPIAALALKAETGSPVSVSPKPRSAQLRRSA